MVFYHLIKISDANHPNALLFPTDIDGLSSFYSTGNVVSITFTKPLSSNLNEFQIKVQKVSKFSSFLITLTLIINKRWKHTVTQAVPCPFNLGPSTSCGRVVDDLSCYCGLFSGVIKPLSIFNILPNYNDQLTLKQRTWAATRDFCKANGMNLVSIETYEEDLALYTALGGAESIFKKNNNRKIK